MKVYVVLTDRYGPDDRFSPIWCKDENEGMETYRDLATSHDKEWDTWTCELWEHDTDTGAGICLESYRPQEGD